MTEKYSSLALANTFLARHAGDVGIQHMKLQKLAYYAHGYWLAYKDEPFLAERPEVWRYGPVFNELYHSLKGYGTQYIKGVVPGADFLEDPPVISDDEELLRLVDWTFGRFGQFSAGQLSEMTHKPGTPWRKIAEECKFRVPLHYEISDDQMKEYFRSPEAQAEARL